MIFDRVYKYEIKKLVLQLLLPDFRQIKWFSWLTCLVNRFIEIKKEFDKYRKDTLYKLDHTSAVFSTENVLNDAFDMVERRIYISDGFSIDPVRFYNAEEQKDVPFFNTDEDKPVRFYDPVELEQKDVDFIVNIPMSIVLGEASIIRLKSLVDFYRLPDKTFTINFYEDNTI